MVIIWPKITLFQIIIMYFVHYSISCVWGSPTITVLKACFFYYVTYVVPTITYDLRVANNDFPLRTSQMALAIIRTSACHYKFAGKFTLYDLLKFYT